MTKDGLGSTLGSTVNDDKIEEILQKSGLSSTEQSVNIDGIKAKTEEKTVKVNTILTITEHLLFKTHTGLQGIDMQVKSRELIVEWLKQQPKIGI